MNSIKIRLSLAYIQTYHEQIVIRLSFIFIILNKKLQRKNISHITHPNSKVYNIPLFFLGVNFNLWRHPFGFHHSSIVIGKITNSFLLISLSIFHDHSSRRFYVGTLKQMIIFLSKFKAITIML